MLFIVAQNRFTAVYSYSGDGWLIGYVSELPGAHAQGKTIDEVRMNLRDSLKLTLEVNRQRTADTFSGLIEFLREPIDEPP
jgi:predicted RNase H-like HicB family nuclease